MKIRARTPATRPRAVLLAAVLLAFFAASFLPADGKTYARSETGPTPTPTATAPAAPQLTATASGNAVELNWTPVPGASRYELHAQLVDDPGWQRLDEGDLTAATHTHRGFEPGRTYQYAVRALDAGGRPLGAWSNFPTATAPDANASTATPTPASTATAVGTPTPTPTPASGPAPTPTPTATALAAPRLTATASGAAIELSWTSVPGAVRYVLYAQLVDNPGWQRLVLDDPAATTHSHRGFEPGRTYQYAVRALDAGGRELGAWSNFPTATAPDANASTATPTPASGPAPTPTPTPTATALAAPRLTATASGAAIELSWTSVPGAARYVLYAQFVDEPGWRQLDEGDLTATAYSHRDLAPGRTYQYAVRALDANGRPLGDWSNFPTATAPASTAPTSPPTPTSTPAPHAAAAERSALIALYNATGGANWTHKNNWLSAAPLETWHGVTADENGRVTALRLGSNGLRGTVPELSALAYLEELFLSSNLLSGSIPELSALAKLRLMDLSRNRLSGPIPDLGALVNLTHLNLDANDLSGPIPDLSALANLRTLNLATNRLSGPVPHLGALANLVSLALQHNRLSGPLPDLSLLPKLVQLNLTANRFCLPDGRAPSGLHSAVAAHLHTLNLAPCTDAGTSTPTPTASSVAAPRLTATASGNAVELSWTSVPGAVRYVLYTQPVDDPGWQRLVLDDPAATSHSHRDLVPGKTYQYAVRAIDANGQPLGDWSNYPTATAPASGAPTSTPTPTPTPTAGPTPTPTPTPPASTVAAPQLTATASGNAVELSWTSVPGAVRYVLYAQLVDNPGWLQLVLDDPAATTHSHRGVEPGRTYQYAVRALDANGQPLGDWSNFPTARAATGASTATPTPTPTPTAPTTERAALTALYHATDGANWTRRDNWLTGAPLGTWYGVTADAGGRVARLSLERNDLSGSLPDLSALADLTNLSLHANDLSGPLPDLSALANLTWLSLDHNRLSGPIPDLSALASLQTLYLHANDLSGPLPDLSALPNLRHLDLTDNRFCLPDGAPPSGLHSAVAAHLRTLNLAPCTDAGTPTPTPTPTASSGAAPRLTATASGNAVELSWTSVPGAVRYVLYAQLVDNPGWRQLVLDDPAAASHTHRGFEPGRTYQYAVRAIDANGQPLGDWSNFPTATAPASGAPTSTPTPTPTPTPGAAPPPPGTAAERAAERAALVALYNATDGPDWTRRDNWLTGAPLSAWYGVTADAGGRVTRLLLGANELRGSIPDLSALANLTNLSLHSNELRGPIPDLSALANLTNLSLSGNDLSGSIPDLSALANLERLSLYSNELSGSIPDLGALANLTNLSLSHNDLSGSIPDLSALANLEDLSLYSNDLSGSIPDLGALVNLTNLSLSGNDLSGPIPDLSALTNLERLSLSANDLSGSIPDLSALVNLETLSLYNNELSGSIPDLSGLANLRSLDLERNRLTGPVPDLSALANLTDLSLASNYLCLPEDAGLSDLNDDLAARVLDLFLPSCTGAPAQLPSSSPAERAALVALYNATGGPNWTNNGNWLTDAPAAAWYGVTTDGRGRVTRLSLRKNGLTGQIPDLSALANLTDLHLGANDLSGPIPDLSALANLEFLVLGTNDLSGPIPDLSALTNLEELHLYTNDLSGPIPDLSALTNLEVLSLSGNDLSGPIPDLSALANLWDLSLYNNELTGPVPDLNAHTGGKSLLILVGNHVLLWDHPNGHNKIQDRYKPDIYVTYGVFMVVFLHARACRRTCIRLLMRDIGRHAQLLTSSQRNVMIWCRKEH